jgi:hypothetical protein
MQQANQQQQQHLNQLKQMQQLLQQQQQLHPPQPQQQQPQQQMQMQQLQQQQQSDIQLRMLLQMNGQHPGFAPPQQFMPPMPQMPQGMASSPALPAGPRPLPMVRAGCCVLFGMLTNRCFFLGPAAGCWRGAHVSGWPAASVCAAAVCAAATAAAASRMLFSGGFFVRLMLRLNR